MPDLSKPKLMSDHFTSNALWNSVELAEAEKRLDSLLERRWKLTEARTVGSLTLNGTSVAACFTALQVGGGALNDLGIDVKTIAFSVSWFAIAAMQAVLALWLEGNHITELSGQQYARTVNLRNEAAILSSQLNKDNVESLDLTIKEKANTPPIDFSYSKASLFLQNGTGVFWLVGVAMLLWKIAEKHCHL